MRKYGLICAWGLLFAVWLSGCSDQKNSVTDAGESNVIGTAASEQDNTAQTIEYGKRETAKYLLQVDINPSFIVGYDEGSTVVYLASNNEDAYQLLKEQDGQGIIGVRLDEGICEILQTAHEAGYEANAFDVEIKSASEEKADLGDTLQSVRQAMEKCNFEVVVSVEEQGRRPVMGAKAVGKGNSSRYGL